MTAALLLAVVSCGATSPPEVIDAGDATDAPILAADSAIPDAVSEAEMDVGFQSGGFFCADPSSYYIEVNTPDGQNLRLIGPCQETFFGAPRFGAARAAMIVGSGPVGLSICAAQQKGASISLSAVLTKWSGGSGTATGIWRDGVVPDAAATPLEGTIDFTRVGSLGDTVEGSYVLTSPSVSLSGSFRVCHVFDNALTPP
jgi:hypothetical protein